MIYSTSWVPPLLPPPPFTPLLSVNYIKGSSHSVNDIPLSSSRVNTHPLRACVRVHSCMRVSEWVSEWRVEDRTCHTQALMPRKRWVDSSKTAPAVIHKHVRVVYLQNPTYRFTKQHSDVVQWTLATAWWATITPLQLSHQRVHPATSANHSSQAPPLLHGDRVI